MDLDNPVILNGDNDWRAWGLDVIVGKHNIDRPNHGQDLAAQFGSQVPSHRVAHPVDGEKSRCGYLDLVTLSQVNRPVKHEGGFRVDTCVERILDPVDLKYKWNLAF